MTKRRGVAAVLMRALPMLVMPALVPVAPAAAADDPLAARGQWSVTARGDAPLPPMGWNSWNAFGTRVDETKVMAAAAALVDSGLAARGYRYVNLDDGWWLRRRATDGRLMIRTANFPSARTADEAGSFRPLTDRLHAMGLKAGIYSDIGRNSCSQVYTPGVANLPEGTRAEREVGLYGHVAQDIALYFGEWNFDLIKVDGCGIRALTADHPQVVDGTYRGFPPLIDFTTLPNTDITAVRALYREVGDALARVRPRGDYLFSLCLWGSADVRSWARTVGNLSRTSEDIAPTWERMLHNLDSAARRELYAHPNSWNDPDMLFVGTGEFDLAHPVEARSHMTLWAMLNAPLIIGYDLRQMTPDLAAVLGNPAVIALNQDPAGNQAVLAHDGETVQIFVKTLADGSKAVALFNRSGSPVEARLTAAQLKLRDDRPVALTDLWDGGTQSFTGELVVPLGRHQTVLLRATGERLRPQGLYLSEQPGRVNPAVDGVVHPLPDPLVHRGLQPGPGTRGDGEHPMYGGWGGARADATPFAQTPKLAGTPYHTAIGVLANSRIEVRNAGFASFSAMVGIDDAAPDATARVRFAVYADGRRLTRTGWLRRGQAPVALRVPVRGARIIELVAEGNRPILQDTPVDWAEAALDR